MRKIIFTVLFYFLSQVCAFSQQDTVGIFDLSLEELMNIEVFSSNKKVESLIETPAVINVITAEEIRFLNFNSLEEVLEYSVGLASVNGEGNVFTTTTIRGNTLVNYNTNTLLLFDGIPLFNAYHGSFDFQSIPISSIDRIEIVKGSNSVLYGTNAVNGVINVISKNAKENGELGVSTNFKYGSYNTFNSTVAITQKKNDWKFAFFTDGTTSKGEPLTFYDEKGNKLNLEKAYKAISTVSKLSYKNLNLTFQFYNRNLPNVRTRGFQKRYVSLTDTVGVIQPEYTDESATVLNLSYFKSLSDKLTLNFRSNFMDWNLRKDLLAEYWDYSSFGVYNDIDITINTSEKFSNKIGVSYNHYIGRRYKSLMDDYDIGKDKIWTDDIAFFINGEYQLFEKLKLFYGGRYYMAKYGASDFSNFSPRIALTYSLSDDLSVKAIYGQSFRIPTYFEKEVASATVVGNPNLLPEKSTSYDLVFSGIIKSFQFDIDGFYTEINDRILRVNLPSDSSFKTNLNTGSISLMGAEFNSKFRFNKRLMGFLGYSYTKGKNIETDEDLFYVFENMLNLGLNYQLIDWLSISSSAKYMSKWGNADAYTLINMALQLSPVKKFPISVEIKVDNILDTDVYLPEIARKSDLVPVIPKTLNRMFYLGVRFDL